MRTFLLLLVCLPLFAVAQTAKSKEDTKMIKSTEVKSAELSPLKTQLGEKAEQVKDISMLIKSQRDQRTQLGVNRDAIKKQVAAQKKQFADLKYADDSQKKALESNIKKLETNIASIDKSMAAIDALIATYQADLKKQQEDLNKLEQQLEELEKRKSGEQTEEQSKKDSTKS